MVHIIHFLIYYFNFEITHISYSNKTKEQINKICKEKNIDNTNPDDILYLYNNLTQCSNLSKFPKNFL